MGAACDTADEGVDGVIAYHGLADAPRAMRLGILSADDESCGCSRPPHICLAERPEVAANFGAVLAVDITGLDVVWEKGEGRLHVESIPPSRLRVLSEQPKPDWHGWEDPCLRINHISCR